MPTTPEDYVRQVPRAHTNGDFAREEMHLAGRNASLPLEALRHEVTPIGQHYLLSHFDIPFVADASDWRVAITGEVEAPGELTVEAIKRLPARTLRVTMECAGNGRSGVSPRWQSMPWEHGAVGTAEWTGTPLRHVLDSAHLRPSAVDIAFTGVDRGFDGGTEHAFARSLTPAQALDEDVLLAWAMNGVPLPPQHGFPLRLIVPGWYGMASVKWLARIEALSAPFDGYQQVRNYMYRSAPGAAGTPVTTIKVRSLMVPPGIPDWYSRRRIVDAGSTTLIGRAWAGGGDAIAKVEVAVDGQWRTAELQPTTSRHAWIGWQFTWNATPGEHELLCRATTASGETQPLEAPWDNGGFGNNSVHRVGVLVR